MVLSAENGFQSALMVPTEVLANQHYEGFLRLMEEQNITSCHPVLDGVQYGKTETGNLSEDCRR